MTLLNEELCEPEGYLPLSVNELRKRRKHCKNFLEQRAIDHQISEMLKGERRKKKK